MGVMDLLLMSSRNEGQPLVAIEAAMNGTPVVAPAVGGLVDLAKDGLVLTARRNAGELAKAMAGVIGGEIAVDRSLLEARGKGFLPERVCGRYLALYRDLIT